MKPYDRIKKRTYEILEKSTEQDTASRIFDIFILTIIILNVIFIILETVESVSMRMGKFFELFELLTLIIFTIEYVLRLWSCNSIDKYNGKLKGRIKFFFQPLTLIDLLAVIPFYLPHLIVIDLVYLRIIRFLRIFRIFKAARYSVALKNMGEVIRDKKEELIIVMFLLFIMLVIASSLMYYAENEAQPGDFASIPSAMWWGIITLTTVGYGDTFPITPLGKILGTVISIIGIGLFALPAGILGSGFVEKLHKQKKRNQMDSDSETKVLTCPHCNKPFISNPQDDIDK